MKAKLTTCALAALLFSVPTFGQIGVRDSLHALNSQKETLEISKEVNEKRIKLAEKLKDLQEKQIEMQQAAERARISAEANAAAAKELMATPQDKKIARKASNAAKDAQRDAENARKEAESFDGLNKNVADYERDIQEMERKLASMVTASRPAATPVPAPVVGSLMPQNNSHSHAVGSGYQRIAPVAGNPASVAEGILESTYKNYPQQQGQPTIIINNIIVPSDYNQKKPDDIQAIQKHIPNQDLQDYEDYKAWLRYRRQQPLAPIAAPNPASSRASFTEDKEAMPKEGLLTFKERFAEKPERNSGLWVIPLAGIHASSFKADLKDDQYQGRSGWNAGLDFRFRTHKFFVQPGIHYFSSSIDVTREDSISSAPLLTGPRIHSLKAPLLLGVYLTKAKGGFFRFNIKGGVVGNYVLNVDRNDVVRFDKDNIEDFSYGLNAGIGLEFGFVTLDLSHEWGMSPLFKDSKQKSEVLRVTLGFKL
jgi:hypothetical protein